MIIDVINSSTFPREAISIIHNCFDGFEDTIKNSIRCTPVEDIVDVRRCLENYVAPNRAYDLYEKLIPVFDKYQITLYHATMVEDIASIKEHGIVPVDIDSFSKNIYNFLISQGVDEELSSKAKELIEKEFSRKYAGSVSRVCFFSNINDLPDSDSAGYIQFCENIGGELTRWALEDKMPEVLKVLRKGYPAVIKFVTEFNNICEFDKDRIISFFVYRYASKYFWDSEFEIAFDGNLEKAISPRRIVEIINIDRESIDFN